MTLSTIPINQPVFHVKAPLQTELKVLTAVFAANSSTTDDFYFETIRPNCFLLRNLSPSTELNKSICSIFFNLQGFKIQLDSPHICINSLSKNQLDISLKSVMRPVCVVNFSLAPFKKTSFKCDENENLIYIKWLAGSC